MSGSLCRRGALLLLALSACSRARQPGEQARQAWARGDVPARGSASLVATPAGAAGLEIRPSDGGVAITTASYRWMLSTSVFDVIHAGAVGDQQRLSGGRASVEALGATVEFGAPSELKNGNDWVELRGWAEAKKNLWYVARYQFFPGRPFVRLVLTLTDRHDESPSSEPWEPYWQNRLFSKLRLEIGAPGGKPARVTQHNSYSYSTPGRPWVEIIGASGAPCQWTPPNPPLDIARFQLVHSAKDEKNQVIWRPMVDGTAELTALITGFSGGSAYRAAKSVSYEVVDANGKTHVLPGDQRKNAISLGTFLLGKASSVRLKASGSGEDLALAGPLHVAPQGGKAFEVKLGERHDGVLTDGPITLAVKDFWQHHPMSLVRTEKTIGWQAIETPAEYTGGMGLTLETMISMDGPAAEARTALYVPPRRALPPEVRPIDGSLARGGIGARYDALLGQFAQRFPRELESSDSFGWRNWGDYQIGVSYSDEKGPVEDWANLQYDLPNGLLLAWLRTGDPELWRFAQASVRHLMDLDLVKFYPFMDKLNGLVYRKGEMPRRRSHIGAEPITDQGFAFRSLLLYYRLTGEEWARDLARQNIDRLVYYAVTRPHFVLNGDRPTGWMLRAALAGAENFPQDPKRNYQEVADAIVGQLVDHYRSKKRLPGAQPVWQGQMLEGLAEVHRRTGRADVAEVIVGHARHLLTNCTRKRPDGRYEFMYCYTPDGKDCPVAQWTDEDNYPFLWLGGIAYAHKLSGDPFFANWADALFSYGEARMRDHSDIRSWTSVLAHTHLFLDVSAARR